MEKNFKDEFTFFFTENEVTNFNASSSIYCKNTYISLQLAAYETIRSIQFSCKYTNTHIQNTGACSEYQLRTTALQARPINVLRQIILLSTIFESTSSLSDCVCLQAQTQIHIIKDSLVTPAKSYVIHT
jgi:hypothetical protein